jgi:hypothetical protein
LARKKTRASKPQLEATLTKDDINLVRRAMEDASEDILRGYGMNQNELYGIIEKDLNKVKQAIRSVHAVPTASQIVELGDEPAQFRRLAYPIEAQI